MNQPEQRRQQGPPQHAGNPQRPQPGQQGPTHGSPASHTQTQQTTVKTTETTKGENKVMKIIRSVRQSVNGFTPLQTILAIVCILLIAAVLVTLARNRGTTRDVVTMDRPSDVMERIPMTFTFPPTNVTVRMSDGYVVNYRVPKAVIYVDFVRPAPNVKADD